MMVLLPIVSLLLSLEIITKEYKKLRKESYGSFLKEYQGNLMNNIKNEVLEDLKTTIIHSGTIYVFGNGGSCEQADHFVAELIGIGIKAISLSMNPAVTSALANDIGYEKSLAYLIEIFVDPYDTVIFFTTSGKSKNICTAIDFMNTHLNKIFKYWVLTGQEDSENKVMEKTDYYVSVPSLDTQKIQEYHLSLIHEWYKELKIWKREKEESI
jgi:D-sedoheptulose 7-phosphate isomerase